MVLTAGIPIVPTTAEATGATVFREGHGVSTASVLQVLPATNVRLKHALVIAMVMAPASVQASMHRVYANRTSRARVASAVFIAPSAAAMEIVMTMLLPACAPRAGVV